MTPKEKANELFYKFYDNKSTDLLETYLKVDLAKMSALIATNELIEHLQPASDFGGEINIYTVEYWQEVKTKIEKL